MLAGIRVRAMHNGLCRCRKQVKRTKRTKQVVRLMSRRIAKTIRSNSPPISQCINGLE